MDQASQLNGIMHMREKKEKESLFCRTIRSISYIIVITESCPGVQFQSANENYNIDAIYIRT